jgi:hypothetical protein
MGLFQCVPITSSTHALPLPPRVAPTPSQVLSGNPLVFSKLLRKSQVALYKTVHVYPESLAAPAPGVVASVKVWWGVVASVMVWWGLDLHPPLSLFESASHVADWAVAQRLLSSGLGGGGATTVVEACMSPNVIVGHVYHFPVPNPFQHPCFCVCVRACACSCVCVCVLWVAHAQWEDILAVVLPSPNMLIEAAVQALLTRDPTESR